MKKNSRKKTVVGILIVFVPIFLILCIKFAKTNAPPPEQVSVSSRSKGNPNAPHKINEFVDFQCPACATGSKILHTLLEKNPQDYYLRVKYFPLEMHLHSVRAARYVECSARQGKFWEVEDAFFEKQPQWRNLINPEPVFSEILKTAGIDPKKLESCLADPTVGEAIVKEKTEGKSLGVQSTPTYFIDGTMFVGTKNLENQLKTFQPVPVVVSTPAAVSPATPQETGKDQK